MYYLYGILVLENNFVTFYTRGVVMKNTIQRIAIMLVLALCFQSPTLYGYAISHNEDSDVMMVDIYVFKSPGKFIKMLEDMDIGKKSIDLILQGAEQAGSFGGPEAQAAVKILGQTGGLFNIASKAIAREANIISYHKAVARGNRGRHAEWNWEDICRDKFGIKRKKPATKENEAKLEDCRWNNKLYVAIFNTDGHTLLWQGYLAPGAGMGFKAVRDASGNLIGEKAPFERSPARSNVREKK